MLNITRKMDGKLAGVWAINTSPLDNPFCLGMAENPDNICSYCYSQKILRGLRRNCRPSMKRNGELLQKALVKIPKIRKPHLFRFSAHGELFNRQHAENYFAIARNNPHVTFAFWTKRVNLLEGLEKPENVILVYSSPKLNVVSPLPEGFNKVFTVFTGRDNVPEGMKINCAGKKCVACQLCYSHNDITFINELVRKR
jgi:hypothetical protein